jgi:hypothetical protein
MARDELDSRLGEKRRRVKPQEQTQRIVKEAAGNILTGLNQKDCNFF